MAKFETVPLAELKTRLPAKLMPLVEEYKEKLGAHFADREHPDRSMVNAPIGDRERSVSDAGRRRLAVELALLSP